MALGLGARGSGATDRLWDHTHKGLLYDTKPSSTSYTAAGSDDSDNNRIIEEVAIVGKADISRFWVEKGAWKHREKYVVFFS